MMGAGLSFAMSIDPDYTIETLKELIFEQKNIPPDQQRLHLAHRQLEDSRTLRYYGIIHDETVHLLIRP